MKNKTTYKPLKVELERWLSAYKRLLLLEKTVQLPDPYQVAHSSSRGSNAVLASHTCGLHKTYSNTLHTQSKNNNQIFKKNFKDVWNKTRL